MSAKEISQSTIREDVSFAIACALFGAGILAAIQAACGVFG